jgi:hypothetical protein
MIPSLRFLVFLWVFLIDACQSSSTLGGYQTIPPSHQILDHLLKKYVNDEGKVNYLGLKEDEKLLDEYLTLLDQQAPDKKTWSKEEQLAYWMNAYNAFTLKLIVLNYPLQSIQELHPTFHIPLMNTVWHKKFFTIGGQKASLDEIEHRVLRKEFNEPRIHFAINCASKSCPPLLNEAFVASKIESQLENATFKFINDRLYNEISASEIRISSIFNWFKDDFTKTHDLIGFLNQYSQIKISPNASISYLPYNWELNE